MIHFTFKRALCVATLCLLPTLSFAWDHSVALGAGFSHDPNDIHYNNYGFMLSGDFLPLTRSRVAFTTLNASINHWRTNTRANNNLTAGAISLALRLYPLTSERVYAPYLLGSAGPAIISNRQFGVNTQAKNITIQTNAGLGVEYGHYDLNLRLAHYSNASLAKPNEGFNILYFLTLGYLF